MPIKWEKKEKCILCHSLVAVRKMQNKINSKDGRGI